MQLLYSIAPANRPAVYFVKINLTIPIKYLTSISYSIQFFFYAGSTFFMTVKVENWTLICEIDQRFVSFQDFFLYQQYINILNLNLSLFIIVPEILFWYKKNEITSICNYFHSLLDFFLIFVFKYHAWRL